MRRPTRAAAGACVMLLAASIWAGESVEPVAPAADLNQRLGKVDTLVADFRQVTVGPDARVLQETGGRLWFDSPASFRIETSEPFAQVLVSDGRDFWTYDADLEQVIVRELEADVRHVPILLLGGDEGDVSSEYDVDYFADEYREHFVLQPLSASNLFRTLSIEFQGDRPSAISLSDSLGQQTRIDFSDVLINQPVDVARFTFDAPPGVDVIDDR